MKRHIPAVVTVILFLLTSTLFALQNGSVPRQEMGIKASMSGYPKAVRLSAQRLVEDGTIVHLSGGVEIRIFTAEKQHLVIRSEEADYNRVTGEVSSRGNSTAVIEAAR